MLDPHSYCAAVLNMDRASPHVHYHDHVYGFPLEEDNELFGRLVLEINQAGLSWTTILNKESNFRRAYAQWDVSSVASFSETDRARLLADTGIIRNRLKVDAAIHNAGVIIGLQREHGSFRGWLDAHFPQDHSTWVKLFKRTFRFTGGEITGEFLMSTGYLPGAHHHECPVYEKTRSAGAPWARRPAD